MRDAGKTDIANALAKNRSVIRRRLKETDET